MTICAGLRSGNDWNWDNYASRDFPIDGEFDPRGELDGDTQSVRDSFDEFTGVGCATDEDSEFCDICLADRQPSNPRPEDQS